MKVKLLSPDQWLKERGRLIRFAAQFGDKRLTATSLLKLRQLDPARLSASPANGNMSQSSSLLPIGSTSCAAGDSIAAVASLDGRLVGFGLAVEAGEECCLVVVHPESRKLGIGSAIVQAMITQFGGLTCMVAADNTASMALCFRLGMTAVSMHRGPTGKPTLRFERRTVHDTALSGHPDPIPQ